MSRRQLEGSTALITGASSGIGYALAQELAARRVNLLVTARREDRLRQLVETLEATGACAAYVAGDITDINLRKRLVDETRTRFGGLDILVNNAGIGAIGPFALSDEQGLRQIMEVNFFAPAELIRQSLPLLEESKHPIVVNIGSVLGHWAVPQKTEYCASKFALHGFTDALNAELRPRGIDVLLITPSTTDSEFFDHLLEKSRGAIESPWKMSAQKVARKTVRAIERGRREVIFSLGGRSMIYLDRVVPWLTSRIVSRWQPPLAE